MKQNQKKPLLILLRHGESQWNQKNVFTGWVDIPLSAKGVEEAIRAGTIIQNIPIDIIFTSALIRAQMTTFLAMLYHGSGKVPVLLHPGEGNMDKWGKMYSEKMEEETIPTFASWHLNERMYGELQGKNKKEMADQFGPEKVQYWRRNYHAEPPGGESLFLTKQRTIPYFQENIMPYIQQGKNVLISAHGNSLRSIAMDIENLSEEEIPLREFVTGEPVFYRYTNGTWEKGIE
ncbi:MAG: 2,3-bisphosphoglycerate-dependent phosphoglycerate mutase [Chlamydiota bacterium]